MREWKLSNYTSVMGDDTDSIFLYNSFMGAIARIPSRQYNHIKEFLHFGADEADMRNPALKELCDGGFFVPSNINEHQFVFELLEKERNSAFSVIILPHESCNFRCLYCYESFKHGKMSKETVEGMKMLIERKAREYKKVSVAWFGGEPLLAPDVIHELSYAFLESCQKNGTLYSSSITTNGYLLSPDVVDSLFASEVKHFQVTLDGPESIHDNNRKLINGKGTYKRILGNLFRMHNRPDEFVVRIRINFNNALITRIDEWLSTEIAPLFANDRRFTLRFHPISKWGGRNDSTLEVCDARLASQARNQLMWKSGSFNFSTELAKEFLKPHGKICYAGKESSIVVGADGTLYKCTVALEDPRNHVGTLSSNGQLIIDQERWDKWVKLDDKDIGNCLVCSYYPLCQGRSCPLAAINNEKLPCAMTREECESLVSLISSGKQ